MVSIKTDTKQDLLIHIGIILCLSSIIALALFCIYLSCRINHSESITVPKLKGMKVDELETFLKEHDLRYEVQDSDYVSNMLHKSQQTISTSMQMITEDCLNEENFYRAYNYIIWKYRVAKKLSPHGNVMFEKNFDIQAVDTMHEGKQLVFFRKGDKVFSVDINNSYISHTKNPNFKEYKEIFCRLTQRAISHNTNP